MMHFLKTTFIATALAASSLAYLPAAHANLLFWDTDTPLYALGTGIFGITAPAYTIGPRPYEAPVFNPDYSYIGPDVEEPSFTYARPVVVVPTYSYQNYISVPVYATPGVAVVSLRPWSPAWYRYCEGRYRSFNPSSGTFTGHDGRQHFCGR